MLPHFAPGAPYHRTFPESEKANPPIRLSPEVQRFLDKKIPTGVFRPTSVFRQLSANGNFIIIQICVDLYGWFCEACRDNTALTEFGVTDNHIWGIIMESNATAELRDQLHEAIGAVDILFLLREEMEQWLEEAQDNSKREALENVLGHLQAMEDEYKHRRDNLKAKTT